MRSPNAIPSRGRPETTRLATHRRDVRARRVLTQERAKFKRLGGSAECGSGFRKLGMEDSNLQYLIQSQACYRYTNPQGDGYVRQPFRASQGRLAVRGAPRSRVGRRSANRRRSSWSASPEFGRLLLGYWMNQRFTSSTKT